MPYLTVLDLEADSKISRHTWRAWIREGRIPAMRLGRRLRIAEEDYRTFMRARRIETDRALGAS